MNISFIRKKIGEILLERGDLTIGQLAYVVEKLQTVPLRFGELCIQEGLVSEDVFYQALAEQFGLSFIELSSFKLDEHILELFPADIMYRYTFVPVKIIDDAIAIAISDPTDVVKLDDLELLLDKPLLINIATPSSIQHFILYF